MRFERKKPSDWNAFFPSSVHACVREAIRNSKGSEMGGRKKRKTKLNFWYLRHYFKCYRAI